jgi:metallophosphoesterase (TIGR03767 family)
MPSTSQSRIIRSKVSADSNWRELLHDKGENVIGEEPLNAQVVAAFIHLSDLHICDAASPARLEFLDRIADPDNPLSQLVPYIGTYRAQEFLTTQVLQAMVVAANEIKKAPLTGAAIDAVVITGDVTDNAQSNELNWYKTILDGGVVTPKSGDSQRSEGSHSSNADLYDIHYYHPDGPPTGLPADRPHVLHDFPHFKGVLQAAERQFVADGLTHKWLAVHGNHDALLQGTAVPTPELDALAQGPEKLAGLRNMADLADLFAGFGEIGPAVYPGLDHMETNEVTADSRRALVKMSDWVKVHTDCEHDHGLDAEQPETSYWYRNINTQARLIALDTVNRFGGWQGCIHREQFEWLSQLLDESKDKYVILTSHHPLENLFNGYVPDEESAPALEAEVRGLLEKHPNVVLWFSGHVHDHKITQSRNSDGSHAFWEIRTGSHIDWPQQSRTIEIVKSSNGKIAIGTVVFDHAGPVVFNGTADELADPVALAGLSRLLAANDWQRQNEGRFALELMEGQPEDRNIWLWANDPLK